MAAPLSALPRSHYRPWHSGKGRALQRTTHCPNCSSLIRSSHAVSGWGIPANLLPGILLNPYGWIVLAVVVAAYLGLGSGIAAVIAAIVAGIIALAFIPVAFPLQIVAPETRDSWMSQHPRLAAIQAGVVLLACIGVFALSAIVVVRMIAAFV